MGYNPWGHKVLDGTEVTDCRHACTKEGRRYIGETTVLSLSFEYPVIHDGHILVVVNYAVVIIGTLISF